MASLAKIGANGEVLEVLSVHNNELKDSNGVEQEKLGIDFLTKLTGWSVWKQTSYNTRGGKHYSVNENGDTDERGLKTIVESENQSKALRKNHASIGYTYDGDKDAFIPPKLFNSWVLNETSCLWEAPVARPTDGQNYNWNEETQQWDIDNS
jgi:hypothetical protein